MHAVFDGVGADTWEENFNVVRTNATIVTFGNASGPVPPFSPLKLSPKCLKVTRPTLFPFIATPEDFASLAKDMTEIVEKGGIKVSLGVRLTDPSSRYTRSTPSLRMVCARPRLTLPAVGLLASCLSRLLSKSCVDWLDGRDGKSKM